VKFGTPKTAYQDRDICAGVPIVASVQLTNLTSSLPQTTLFTPSQNGLYRVSPYMVITVPVSTGLGSWQFYLNWADDAGQEQWTGPSVAAPQIVPGAYTIKEVALRAVTSEVSCVLLLDTLRSAQSSRSKATGSGLLGVRLGVP
jgi:hypothetical protein